MPQNLSKDYDYAFFLMHTGWKVEYNLVADALAQHLQFKTVLDLGCGNGLLINRLADRRWRVTGVDGSRASLHFRPRNVIKDLAQPVSFHGTKHDLVICTEVAEHLAERHADTLVDSICNNANTWVFFSAAEPSGGQGHLHVNEQPREYWIEKFKARNFHLHENATQLIQSQIETVQMIWWFRRAYVLQAKN